LWERGRGRAVAGVLVRCRTPHEAGVLARVRSLREAGGSRGAGYSRQVEVLPGARGGTGRLPKRLAGAAQPLSIARSAGHLAAVTAPFLVACRPGHRRDEPVMVPGRPRPSLVKGRPGYPRPRPVKPAPRRPTRRALVHVPRPVTGWPLRPASANRPGRAPDRPFDRREGRAPDRMGRYGPD
jgi:hypothetical protein